MEKFKIGIFMDSVRKAAGEYEAGLALPRKIRRCLRYDGEEFVRRAYAIILKRDADAIGLADYSRKARGPAQKLMVMASLGLSPENLARHAFTRGIMRIMRRARP